MSRIPGLGQILTNKQPTIFARARVSSAQNVSTTQPCDFDTIEIDPYNIITTGSSWKATAPFACYCWVSTTMHSSTSATLRIYKNGTYATSLDTFNAANVAGGSTLLELVADDYIDVRSDIAVTNTGDGQTNHVSIEMTAR